jgi:hypothetical protein
MKRNTEDKDLLIILKDAKRTLKTLHQHVLFLKITFKEFQFNEDGFCINCVEFHGNTNITIGITSNKEFILSTHTTLPATFSSPPEEIDFEHVDVISKNINDFIPLFAAKLTALLTESEIEEYHSIKAFEED